MKKYMVYVDDGENVMKLAIPSESVKSAKKYVQGNGEVIKVTDVTADYPISAEKVASALLAGGFGQVETDFITRTLCDVGIADMD